MYNSYHYTVHIIPILDWSAFLRDRWQQQVKNCPEKLHSEDTDTRAVHIVVVRPSGHSCGRGYNPRLMSSIWCAPQVPSCQTYIYTLLKAAPHPPPLLPAHSPPQLR